MQFRTLGRTGLTVSALSFGTVSLGVDYGIASPGNYGCPTDSEALNLLRMAADSGITLFDTAPAYGKSEQLLGKALARERDCLFASKITVPSSDDGQLPHAAVVRKGTMASIDLSLRSLQRDCLDIVQIHNATVEIIMRGDVAELLIEARQSGKIRFLGASVYTEAEALAVINAGCFDLLQLPFSILDQRPAVRVLQAAETAGVAILNRSALLKGVLSTKGQWLPSELAVLCQGAQQVVSALAGCWEALPETALRFCLTVPQIASVLIGARTGEELSQALAAEANGGLTADQFQCCQELALDVGELLNPATWPVA